MVDPRTLVDAHLPEQGWAQLARWLADAGIDLAEIAVADWGVHLSRETGYQPHDGPAPAALPPTEAVFVTAPMAGIFHDRHPMRKSPLVQPGTWVGKGDIVGFLQMGVLLTPVASPVRGLYVRSLVASGALVGYARKLIQIDTGGPGWKST